ncbi:signal peptidase I [Anaerolineae bacterium]|nr:signal peptidase I [Anaerolineae bacterium]
MTSNPFPINPPWNHSTPPRLAPEQMAPNGRRTWRRSGQRLASGLILLAALGFLVVVILGVAPLFLGLRPFVVISGSMEPTIHTGAIALARSVSTHDLHVGDVIAFNPREEATLPVIHRIVAMEERKGTRYVTTRGDANTGDDTEIALPPAGLQVIGSIPLVGYAVYYAAQPIGTVLLIWIPVALLAMLWIKDRVMGMQRARHA